MKQEQKNFKEEEIINNDEQEDLDMAKFIYAYDPIIHRRVVHIVKNGWATSLVTGHKFWYGEDF